MTEDAKKAWLRSLLSRQLSVTVSDGRIFQGCFMCTDQEGSAILSETQEYRGHDQRYVGLVVVPGRHIKKVELMGSDEQYT